MSAPVSLPSNNPPAAPSPYYIPCVAVGASTAVSALGAFALRNIAKVARFAPALNSAMAFTAICSTTAQLTYNLVGKKVINYFGVTDKLETAKKANAVASLLVGAGAALLLTTKFVAAMTMPQAVVLTGVAGAVMYMTSNYMK